MSINKNLFDALPIGFFNCLASGSSNRIYSDCLLLIYHEYDREITYRIARSRIRDALAIYLLENHIDYLDDEMTTDRNYNQLANSVIRKFCSKEVGWLEEDTDDATYEKHIMMTEQGVFLAEFLQKMMKPEWEEFSSYIFNIYNILQTSGNRISMSMRCARFTATRNSSPARSSAWRPLSKKSSSGWCARKLWKV